ncbi:MAG: multidrug efflux MFS transporter [Chloroflexi bacterium]|nr:multidrug efflux MFS transporter [Chloroflexota bacterium]
MLAYPPTTAPGNAVPSLRQRLKPEYAVAIVYVAAMFVNILDTTVVTVALPTLTRDFDVATSRVDWVVTGYLLSLAVWIPASGWIGDRVGTKRTFLFAIVVFTSASALSGFAQSLDQLIGFRILQGVGGGMLTPVGFAMLMRAFPPARRAQASKVLIIPTALAPALGPIVGGFLVDSLSWRWVFFINLPIGAATFVFGAIMLHEHREPRKGGFDIPGFALSGTGLALILYALSVAPRDGWGSPKTLIPGTVGLVSFALLVMVELRRAAPMLQLRLVADRLFRTMMLTSVFSTSAFLGILFVMPLFLQEARGVSALQSGLTTFPEAIGVLLNSQIAGRLYPRLGPRRLMAGGLISFGIFLTLLTRIDLGTNLWEIRALMFFIGGSMSYVFLPLQAGAFARITPAETGHASAIFNTQRQMSSALGVAVLATVLSATLPDGRGARTAAQFSAAQVSAFHDVFLVAAALAFVGAAIALTVKDSDAVSTMRAREPAPEAIPSEAS